jgi:peptidoglycan/LPS O-acetylase OafA/YrhL
MTIGYSLIAQASAGIVLGALDDDSWIARLLRNGPLSAPGTISYGFYLFHLIPEPAWQHLANLQPRLRPYIPVIAFVATAGFSWLSFHFWETPFLKLKRTLAPQRDVHIHVSEPHI